VSTTWTASVLAWLADRLLDALTAIGRGSMRWLCGDPYDPEVDG
jgi:hypothetical protein